jgi:hypothetical protein
MWENLQQFALRLWELGHVIFPMGIVVIVFLWWIAWKRFPQRRWHRTWLPAGAILYALFCSYVYWYYHRPLPNPESRELFPGIHYIREVTNSPRPLVIHLVRVDLNTPGLDFLVTPGDCSKGREILARTTSQFLTEFDLQLAINGGFFSPWQSNEPLYYYPKSGQPVDVQGLAISAGRQYSDPKRGHNSLSISSNNVAFIGETDKQGFNVISGRAIILNNGMIPWDMSTANDADGLHPRTVVALNEDRTQLLLIVIDGRQPNYSEGATLFEVAEIAKSHGAHSALNLDGGGSSALVVRAPDGSPQVLNTPIRGRIPPGRERPVGNHLGIRIRAR